MESFIHLQKLEQEKDIALISKPVLGRGCYDCKYFTPNNEVAYIAGRCKFRGNMTEPAIDTVLRQGCEWFELRDDLSVKHWSEWDKKERDEA